MTDYEADLLRLGEDDSAGATSPGEQSARRLYRQFQRLVLIGDLRGLSRLDAAIEAAIDGAYRQADLWLLRAYVAIKLHRFRDAESFLGGDASLRGSMQGLLLQADVDFQMGRYGAARSGVEAALELERTWDGLARLAHLELLKGHYDVADELLLEAENGLTVKQMCSFAWLEVQRGLIRFGRGLYDEALTRYDCARRAYSGYWLVEERVAEARGARGEFAVAVAEYERLCACTFRPEWAHALGELHAMAGDQGTAHRWKRVALEYFLESAARGDVFYLHALADLCCEMASEGANAVIWARKDVALRENYATQGDLAWALYRHGEVKEAVSWIERALASEVVSVRLFIQAACIFGSAGLTERSREMMRLTRLVNPAPARARVAVRVFSAGRVDELAAFG